MSLFHHRTSQPSWLATITALTPRLSLGPRGTLIFEQRAAQPRDGRFGSMLSKKPQTALRLISRRKTKQATTPRRYATRPVAELTGEFIAL
jgi:hypothetical protein